MKILLVHPWLEPLGGAEQVVLQLLNYLVKKYSVTLIVSKKTKDIKYDNTTVVKDLLTLRREILRTVREYDIVNYHNHPVELFQYPIKHPSVWMCNEPPPSVIFEGKLSSMERHMVRSSISSIVVNSYYERDRVKKYYGLNSRIVRYGISIPKVSKDVFSKWKDKLDDRYTYLITTGWHNKFKNQELSIITLSEVTKVLPNVKLILVGETSYYTEYLYRLIDKLKLKDKVLMIKHLPKEEVIAITKLADIVLIPYKKQGGLLYPFEAMLCKKLVLISSISLASEICLEHNVGLVTDNFKDIIIDYIKEPDKFKELIDKNYSFVKNYLTWNNYCENMENILLNTLEEEKWMY